MNCKNYTYKTYNIMRNSTLLHGKVNHAMNEIGKKWGEVSSFCAYAPHHLRSKGQSR